MPVIALVEMIEIIYTALLCLTATKLVRGKVLVRSKFKQEIMTQQVFSWILLECWIYPPYDAMNVVNLRRVFLMSCHFIEDFPALCHR